MKKKGFIGKTFAWLEKTRAGRTVLDTVQAIPIPIVPQLITAARNTSVESPAGHVQWKRGDTYRSLVTAFILVGITAGWFKLETVEKIADIAGKLVGIIESSKSLIEPLFIVLPQ